MLSPLNSLHAGKFPTHPCHLLIFLSKGIFFNKLFRLYHKRANNLNSYTHRHFVEPDLGGKCSQRSSTDDKAFRLKIDICPKLVGE